MILSNDGAFHLLDLFDADASTHVISEIVLPRVTRVNDKNIQRLQRQLKLSMVVIIQYLRVITLQLILLH
jgi:hypothetical protein